MQQHLYKYLLLHHKLSIPALGSFRVVYHPAYINESTGLLFPRRPVIEFSESIATGPDHALVHFLSSEMEIEEAAATKELQNFSIKLLVEMVEQHSTDLPGIGKIKKEMNGQVIFFPASNLIDILPPLRMDEKIAITRKPPVKIAASSSPVAEEEKVQVSQETVKPAEILQPVQIKETEPASKPAQPTMAETKEVRPVHPARQLRPETQKDLNELMALKNEASKITAKVVEMKPVAEVEENTEKLKLERWQVYALALAGVGLLAIVVHAVTVK